MSDIRSRAMWPMQSRGRFIGSASAALVGLVLVARIMAATGAESPAPVAAPAPAASPTASAPARGSDAPRQADATALPATSEANPPGEASTVATGFLAAWGSSTLPAAEWQAGIVPFATPELAEALSDPTRVPPTVVSGASSSEVTPDGGAEVSVSTDTGAYLVFLQATEDGWKVRDVQPIPEGD